uniref:DUF7516 domain-containing protein n=1 Tax=Meloidogyne javanica TaxID=6303 RepID=A0A915LLW2_MELJA
MANPLAKLTISDKVNEGRKRMLTCLAKKGAEEDHVNLLELQKQYFVDFETYLNKDELRRFFSKTHIKQVFESFMPKDIEMTTDVEQTGSLYLKMKRPLEVALADNPLAPRRSALSKNDTKALNLVPLPATKFESNARQEKKFSGGIWDEPSPEKEVKGNETFLKNPTSKTSKPSQNIAGDLYSDDELETGLENKEEDEDSDYFGDEALEEGNRLLSSTAAKDVMKDETRKNPPPTSIGIRTSCHADKYILELQKRKNAFSSTLLDLDKENSKQLEQQQQVSFDNFDLEKKRITENARARLLEFKKSEQQKLKNRQKEQKQPILSGGFGAKKIRANQLNRNNLLSSDDETADIEEIGQNEGEGEDFEEEEEINNNEEEDGPVIIMSRPDEEKEGLNKFGGGEKKNSPDDDLINDYVADEQYYRDNPKKDTTCEKQEMSEYMRLEMIAMTTILVRLNVAIKLDVLHSELTKYNANAFSSNSDLLEFIKKNCPTSVIVQDCGFNTILLIWNESTTEENRKVGLSYLLQKVGKSLDTRT